MEGLGIDLKFVLAQLINFGLLIFILKKLLYGPILKVLEERRQKIAESLADAERIKKELNSISIEKEQILKSARGEGLKIIEESRDIAEKQKEELVINAQKEAKEALDLAQRRLREEEEAMVDRVRERITKLAGNLAEKILSEKLNEKSQHQIIEKQIGEIKNEN